MPPRAFEIHREEVQPEWIDYNGHMNVAYYELAFDHATDGLLDLVDLGLDYAGRSNNSSFVLESHVTYARELALGDPLRFDLLFLDADEKRLHYFFEMHHAEEDYLAATSEQIAIHVSLESRRTEAFPEPVMRRLEALKSAHAAVPRPTQIGRVIGIRRKAGA